MSGFDVLEFLRHYQLHPCLWDRRHEDYKNRQKREAAEQELLPISGLSCIKELRAKIRSIRCTYNQEISKIRNSCQAVEPYRPKLLWFSYANDFLKKNHEEEMETELNSSLCFHDFVMNNCGTVDKTEFVEIPVDPLESVPSPCDVPADPFPPDAGGRGAGRGKAAKKPKVDRGLREAVAALRAAAGGRHPASEFSVFGQHVVVQLGQLPLGEALRLQEEIQSSITRARLRAIQSASLL
ncbi:uncharacterized protein LOC134540679 [Bacillus rossius redtenbacheri]|uniref:uncharacterized protein LOC134540679 n=1 Tax=Bacillus rossius redtenbacheri TaxID=93214 RepID=UPI002FDDFEF5